MLDMSKSMLACLLYQSTLVLCEPTSAVAAYSDVLQSTECHSNAACMTEAKAYITIFCYRQC